MLGTCSGQLGADWRISSKDTLSSSIQYRDTSNVTTRSPFSAAYGAGGVGDAAYSQGVTTAVGTVTQANQTNWVRPNKNTHATLKDSHLGDGWLSAASRSDPLVIALLETSLLDHRPEPEQTVTLMPADRS